MATKAKVPERGRASTANPIAHVTYQARDLAGIDVTGGSTKELVPVTPELRVQLQTAIAQVSEIIAAEAAAYPDIPSILIVQLRDTAIAKTHRPIELIAKSGMTPAGHGLIDEMLVTANAVNLGQLSQVVAQKDTKKIRANISAVQGFEAWGVQRRLPRNLRGKPIVEVYQLLRIANRRLMVKLFSHRAEAMTRLISDRLTELLTELGITPIRIEHRVGQPTFLFEITDAFTVESLSKVLEFQGVRQVFLEPIVWPAATILPAGPIAFEPRFTGEVPAEGLPIVGVFDTGADPRTPKLAPWITSRDPYVLPPETDYAHGTSVCSLIIDSAGLNASHPLFPLTPCQIHDVCGLESNGSRVNDLVLRLREAVAKRPDIKVWNLSLGGQEVTDDEFSDFARELDVLSDLHKVLFVVAAGNYLAVPRRGWPINGAVLADRLSSPGDSIRSLTVGAVTHLDNATTMVRTGEPAPYSRRGPGPVFTPKPDLVHIGGNADADLNSVAVGVHVLAPGGGYACLCGTSFASPIAASMAAHTWKNLELPGRAHALTVTPTMVKALMIHCAQLNSPDRSAGERRYFGAGLPSDPVSVLYDTNSSFTTVFELDIADTTKWRKAPFPIPPSLTVDGKLRCEVVITAAYAPPLNSAAGAEYVRVNVDVGFGTLTPDAKGKPQFHSQVPVEGEKGTNGYEKAQVEHGGKWSPVKIYRQTFPKGKAGDVWALQASIVRRAFEPPLAQPLRVIIIVTLRALDGNENIYDEGQRVLAATNWITQNLSQRVDIPIRV